MTVGTCAALCPSRTVRFDISDGAGPDWGSGSGWGPLLFEAEAEAEGYLVPCTADNSHSTQ